MKRIILALVAVLAGSFGVASARPALTKPVLLKKTVINPLYVACLGLSVTPNQGASPTLKSGCKLTGATAVHFAGAAAGFSVQPDGTIAAQPPALPAGSTVPVTVTMPGGRIVGGRTSLYSYPIAEMSMEGPYSFPLGEDQASTNWWNGSSSHILRESQPATLTFTTLTPTLYVTASFGNTQFAESTQAPYVLGNIGLYTAKLQVCTPASPSPFPAIPGFLGTPAPGDPCTNWDTSPGYWKDVTTAAATVHAPPGTQIGAFGTLALSTASLFTAGDPASTQLAHTLRIVYGFKESDNDAQFATRVGLARFDEKKGKPFNAIVPPSALVQVRAMPYTILYQPPGDQSTVSFTAAATYGANYTLGSSAETDTTNTQEQNKSAKFTESYAALLTLGFGDSSSWDTTTKQFFGTNNGTTGASTSSSAFTFTWQMAAAPNQIPGSGAVCATVTNCATLTNAANAYAAEPFWLDTFVLLVHPQYAYWQLAAQGQSYLMYGAVPVTADITVAELDACARGQTWYGVNPCQIDYSDSELTAAGGGPVSYAGSARMLTLTVADARNLLALDPFYAQGQNANILPTRATPMGSPTYGASIGVPARPYVSTLANTAGNQQTGTTTQTYTATAITTVSDDPSISLGSTSSGSGSALSYNSNLSIDDLTKSTSQTDLKTTFNNSTAVSNQRVTTANVVLNDVDSTSASCKTCHNPLPHAPSVNIYFDRVFGSFMFQDPGAARGTIFTKPVCCEVLLRGLLAHEAHLRRFSDVPKGDPNAAILGLMARAGLVPAASAHTFAPQSAVRMSTVTGAVTRARAHASSAQAASSLAFKATAGTTREQAAVLLFKALTAKR